MIRVQPSRVLTGCAEGVHPWRPAARGFPAAEACWLNGPVAIWIIGVRGNRDGEMRLAYEPLMSVPRRADPASCEITPLQN